MENGTLYIEGALDDEKKSYIKHNLHLPVKAQKRESTYSESIIEGQEGMSVKICFDFHDIFVDAKTAWIEAFSNLCNEYKENAVIDYNNKVSKKEICRRYKLKYEEVEEVYRKHLKPINRNIELAKEFRNIM